MVIAINGRFLINKEDEGIEDFTREVVKHMAEQHSHHSFYIIYDRQFEQPLVEAANIQHVILHPAARNPLLWKYWFDFKIPSLLKKIKADVFLSGEGIVSLATSIPQCLIIHDLHFLHHPQGYLKSHLWFYKKYTPQFFKKTTSIATVSGFLKDDIIKTYSIAPEKIRVIYNAANDSYKPLSFEEKSAMKQQYTSAREYFIYADTIHPRKNLINLLKAFSIFKKRQKSNWKLVLAGRYGWKKDEFKKLLGAYKYKDDVWLAGYIAEEEMAKLIAGAYAFIYPSYYEGFGVPVLKAMKCEVPVLTSENSAMQEIAGDAALYFDPLDTSSIADKMMLIYKDENLRTDKIEKGRARAANYSWNKTADLLWQSIEEAAATSMQ